MKIGLVGYQGSGKSTLFHWLTGVAPDPALAHTGQTAMCPIPEARVEQLSLIYHPKKITMAAMEVVDTPGLNRAHEGNAARLAMLREAGALVLVVAAFGGADPVAELRAFDEDLLLADMEILAGRIERVEETFKKPRAKQDREQSEAELHALQGILAAMEAGKPLAQDQLSDEQLKVTRSFRLLTEKPKLVIVNTADDESDPGRFAARMPAGVGVIPIPVGLESELAKMAPEDRAEFEREMGVGGTDRDQLVRTMLDVSGQMIFLTAGEKEVRTWLLHKGGTAVEAAGSIHTDLARGFIRAEIMTCRDLVRLGSEREVKANHLVRQEPKDYVVQDDDILLIRFSV
jgi:ribosome-binding ATPase YchF (GTP1/OBG family)